MSLSDIVGRAILLCEIDGITKTHKAVEAALALVSEDDEARDQLLREALFKRIKDAATKMRRVDDEDRQVSFFGDKLRFRYALDLDGHTIKETNFLTRKEFDRLISIREKQITDDLVHLNVLKEAQRQLSPIWDLHPEYTYGEAERTFLAGAA